jgi:uncharacterized protein YbcI
MTSSNLTPTSGQLERSLSQKILALYREQLGHQPSNLPKIKQEIEKIAEVNITGIPFCAHSRSRVLIG